MTDYCPLQTSRAKEEPAPIKTNSPEPAPNMQGASFDTTESLSGMKKLQDPTKYEKARFSFRLYKR